jgi:hypothetical protein
MPQTMVTLKTAERNLQSLIGYGQAQLFMLALKLNIFKGDKPQEGAFLTGTSLEEKAQIVLRALQEYDASVGTQASPVEQPTAGPQPGPMQPMNMTAMPQPVGTTVYSHPAPIQPAPQPIQPMPMPVAAASPPQPVRQPQTFSPQPMQPMQPMAQPAAMPAGRQPSTPSDPNNTGSTAAANALTNVVSALKTIQNGLAQCPGKADIAELRDLIIKVCATQNAILILLMRLAEPHLGLPTEALAQLIDAAVKSGEPEKWFEGIGNSLGKR